MSDQLMLFCPVCGQPESGILCPKRSEPCGFEPDYIPEEAP